MYGQKRQITKTHGQSELFAGETSSTVEYEVSSIESDVKETREIKLKTLNQEKKVLGLYLSGHPINEFKEEFNYT